MNTMIPSIIWKLSEIESRLAKDSCKISEVEDIKLVRYELLKKNSFKSGDNNVETAETLWLI